MPKTIETTVYAYNELSDKAKEKAKAWYSETLDSSDYYHVQENFEDQLRIIGFYDVVTQWSGFNSQGDGACFTGRFECSDVATALAKLNEYHNFDKEFLEQAAIILNIANNFNMKGETLRFRVIHSGRYYHHNSIDLSDVEIQNNETGQTFALSDEGECDIRRACRMLCIDLYKRLDDQNDELYSDEQINETMAANEYTFLENGQRFG